MKTKTYHENMNKSHRKEHRKMLLLLIPFLAILVFSFLVEKAFAQAFIYVSPSSFIEKTDSYREGYVFTSSVYMDTSGQTIGVAEGKLSFPTNRLKVLSIDNSDSIFSLWVEEPQVSGQVIKFAGGIPGGFRGNDKVFDITFEVKIPFTANLSWKSARVLSFAAEPLDVLGATDDASYPFRSPLSIPEVFVFEEERQRDDLGIDIGYLQLCLTKIEGLYDKEVHGYYTNATERAVAVFQEKYRDEILTPQGLTAGTGVVDELTRKKLNEVCKGRAELIPEELFDITFSLEDATIEDINDLIGIITFLSFGRIPTPVDLTFVINDEAGNEVYREKGYIVVQTEEALRKEFEGLTLPEGGYTLILETLYNVDVFDEFRQDFVIKEKVSYMKYIWWIILILIALSFFFFSKRRKKKEEGEIEENEKAEEPLHGEPLEEYT